MKAIFASKMYKSSPRKDKIRAALSDPINVELVQQLREYLDDEYVDEKYLEPEGEPSDVSETDSEAVEGPAGKEATSDHPVHHSSSELSPDESSSKGDELEEPAEDVVDEEVEESDDAEGQSITAVEDPEEDVHIDEQSVLDMLNANESSFGVRRVQLIQNELWIYYLDTTNLNTVMESVISQLSNNYPNLSFSRLARTSNAVVFTLGE